MLNNHYHHHKNSDHSRNNSYHRPQHQNYYDSQHQQSQTKTTSLHNQHNNSLSASNQTSSVSSQPKSSEDIVNINDITRIDKENRKHAMEEDKDQSDSSKRLKANMDPTKSSSLSTTAVEKPNVQNAATAISVNKTIASIEKKEESVEDLFRWSDCRRQEAILLGNNQLLQIHITAATAHSKSKNDEEEEANEMKEKIQKLRIQLFQNALATLTTFNEIISNALILANQIAIASAASDNSTTEEMNKVKIAQLQDICHQTSLWSEMMENYSHENKTEGKAPMVDEREDLDLVIDEDIVILDGKKPRNNDLLCPISCKPFVQPMINQSSKPCSHRVDKSSLPCLFSSPVCGLGLVPCPIPGCNGRWSSAHVLEDSRQNVLVETAVSVKVETQNSSATAESQSVIGEEDTTSILLWWPTARYFKNYNPGNKNHPEDPSNQWIQLQIPDCQIFCRFPSGYTESIATGNILVLSETSDRPSDKNLRIYIQDKTTMHLTKRIYIERFLRTSMDEIQFNGYITPYRAVRLDSEPNYDKHKQWYRNIDYPFALQFTKGHINIFAEENQAHPSYRLFYTLLYLLQSLSENCIVETCNAFI